MPTQQAQQQQIPQPPQMPIQQSTQQQPNEVAAFFESRQIRSMNDLNAFMQVHNKNLIDKYTTELEQKGLLKSKDIPNDTVDGVADDEGNKENDKQLAENNSKVVDKVEDSEHDESPSPNNDLDSKLKQVEERLLDALSKKIDDVKKVATQSTEAIQKQSLESNVKDYLDEHIKDLPTVKNFVRDTNSEEYQAFLREIDQSIKFATKNNQKLTVEDAIKGFENKLSALGSRLSGKPTEPQRAPVRSPKVKEDNPFILGDEETVPQQKKVLANPNRTVQDEINFVKKLEQETNDGLGEVPRDML